MELHADFTYTFSSVFAHYQTLQTLRLHSSLGDKLKLPLYMYLILLQAFSLCHTLHIYILL
jgi:hypothetical protein